jgi:hypothetical protein
MPEDEQALNWPAELGVYLNDRTHYIRPVANPQYCKEQTKKEKKR